MLRVLGSLVVVSSALVASPVLAAPVIPVNTVALFTGTGSSVVNNSINIDDGTVKVQVTAWNTTSTNLASNSARARGTLDMWDFGLGATYSGDGSHTIDNNGRYDFILLQFNTAVALNTVTFTSGWDGSYDTDATISRANVNNSSFNNTYKNVSSTFWNAASSQLAANQTSSMTANNSFQAGVVNSSRRQVNPTLVTSNVWLIAAKIGSNDTYKDTFKIKGFTYVDPYDTGAVPEPATWAMLILGMGMVGGAMRRKARAKLALA